MSMEALFLPYADRELTASLNGLFLAQAGGICRLGSEEWRITLEPPVFPACWRVWAYFRWGANPVSAFADALPPSEDVFPGVPPALLPMLPSELIAAGLEAWLGQALDAFSAEAQRPNPPLVLEEGGFGEKEVSRAGDMLGFLLQRVSDGACLRGVLAFTPEAAKPLAELADAFSARPKANWDKLPVSVRREIGVCMLRLAELASLNPGDIVFPEDYFPQSLGGPRLSVDSAGSGTLHFFTQEQERTITVRGWHMSEAETESSGAETAISKEVLPEEYMGELSVRVLLELDALTLPLSVLRDMRVGYVLETGKGVESPVTIRVGGKIVGTGELLDVAGRVGVRIRTMRPEIYSG